MPQTTLTTCDAARFNAMASPSLWAEKCSQGKWKMFRHTAMVDHYLTEVAVGRIKRLMVLEPPGHGKTVQISHWFPAWYLGMNPQHTLLLVSYGKDLAREASEISRDILRDHGPEYVGFGIDGRRSAGAAWQVGGHGGGMRAVGMGGTVTGRHPNGIIADDLVKDASAALSAVQRESAWKWWQSTLINRLMPDGWIIVTGYRWHNDDLLGRILADGQKRGEPWTVLRLPAVAEEDDPLDRRPGDALWPEVWPLKKLQQHRASPYWWAAQYALDPRNEGGVEWPPEWFGRGIWFDEWPTGGQRVATCDSSKGKGGRSGDYSAIIKSVWKDGTLYVDADMANDRNPPTIAETVVETQAEFKSHAFGLEEEFGGEVLAAMVQEIANRRKLPIPLVLVATGGVKKEIRIQRLGSYLQRGVIRFKNGSPGAKLLVRQLEEFPISDHDDGPDALEMNIRILAEGQ